MKPSDGNQHRKKKLRLLIAKAINSLPHKSFHFCSPMRNIWLYSYETIRWKPASQKETSPLDRFAINSLPHKSFRFCSPMHSDGNHHTKLLFIPPKKTVRLEPENVNQQTKPSHETAFYTPHIKPFYDDLRIGIVR